MTFWDLFWTGSLGQLADHNNQTLYPTIYPQYRIDVNDDTKNPWDDLGLTSPLAFLEIVSTTAARITQVGIAPWVNFNPVARVTQVGAAPWIYFNPEARITQVGFTVWRTTDDRLKRLVNVYFL